MTGIIYTLFSNLNLGRYHFVVTRVGLVGLTRVVGSRMKMHFANFQTTYTLLSVS
jgi:hypothetical protein